MVFYKPCCTRFTHAYFSVLFWILYTYNPFAYMIISTIHSVVNWLSFKLCTHMVHSVFGGLSLVVIGRALFYQYTFLSTLAYLLIFTPPHTARTCSCLHFSVRIHLSVTKYFTCQRFFWQHSDNRHGTISWLPSQNLHQCSFFPIYQ